MVKPFPHPEYVFYTALQSGILTNKPLFLLIILNGYRFFFSKKAFI